MSLSRSEFLRVRGLRYHIRRWGDANAPQVFLLHGWLDVSATWQFFAEGLLSKFQVLCPDWRGFGYTEWPQDGYWFQDYLGDFDAIAQHYSPGAPLRLVGHSMGGQVASLYAGLRPERVAQLVCLDSLFLPDMEMSLVPRRVRAWLEELREPPQQKQYPSFEELAQRVRKQHPALSPERALFVARCWGREDGRGRISLCADPKHRMRGPGLYHVEESMAVWKEVSARTLFLDGADSSFAKALPSEEVQRRRACFRQRSEARVEDCGHMMHFDRPEDTATAVLKFLSQ